ncbi:MAG: BMP family ABC transporter substrate-binding protein [Actinomycetota bacterium]
MTTRIACALAAFLLFLTACGGGETTPEAVSAEDVPPLRLALADILSVAEESAAAMESLDELCQRAFPAGPIRTDITVGLVADVASIDDGTFNQAAFEGMEAAGRCFGVDTTFLESAGDDAEVQINSMTERDVDIVITVGFQFEAATQAAVIDRPDLRFIGVDQNNPTEAANYVAMSFQDHQVGFLAGTAAALLSETGTVAVIAGPDTIPPVVAIADGFEAGVRNTAPETEVLRRHLSGFNDGGEGATTADEVIQQGADVVFGAAGEAGAAAIHAAAAKGASVIGVDQDEYFTTFLGGGDPNADALVTSAIKRVDLGVFLTVAAMVAGDLEVGGSILMDAANGGVTYAPFHEADVPASVATKLEAVRAALASGELDATGTD